MSIKIRPYETKDFYAIHEMITTTWYQEASAEAPSLTDRFVNIDIDMRLKESSFGLVAEYDGEVLGVFLGDVVDQEKTLRLHTPHIMEDIYAIAMSEHPLKEQLLKQLKTELSANSILDENHEHLVDGIVQLFILSPHARGKGIGGKLWTAGLEELKAQGVKHYILHTDSDCDFSFYDYKGLQADPAHLADESSDFKHYLYSGNIE